jgi:hypothetical protein
MIRATEHGFKQGFVVQAQAETQQMKRPESAPPHSLTCNIWGEGAVRERDLQYSSRFVASAQAGPQKTKSTHELLLTDLQRQAWVLDSKKASVTDQWVWEGRAYYVTYNVAGRTPVLCCWLLPENQFFFTSQVQLTALVRQPAETQSVNAAP